VFDNGDQVIEVGGGAGIKSLYNLSNRVIIPNTDDGWVLTDDTLSIANNTVISGRYQSPEWIGFDTTGTRAGYVILYGELDSGGETERLDFGDDASLQISALIDNFFYDLTTKELTYYPFSSSGGRDLMIELSFDRILRPIDPLALDYSDFSPLYANPNPTLQTAGTVRDYYSYSTTSGEESNNVSPSISMINNQKLSKIFRDIISNSTSIYGIVYALSISFTNSTQPDPFTMGASYFEINTLDANNPTVIYTNE